MTQRDSQHPNDRSRPAAADVLAQARRLRACDAILGAIDLLETWIESAEGNAGCDEALHELIDLCDAAWDDDRFHQHFARTSALTPRARLRGAAVLLRMGEFERARDAAASLREHHALGEEAANVAAIAALALGAAEEAAAAMERVVRRSTAHAVRFAQLWRDASLGRLLNDIRSGLDRDLESPLTDLLRWSRSVLSQSPDRDSAAVRQHALCDAALSRHAA